MSAGPVFDLLGPLPEGRVAIEASAGTGKTFTLAGLAARYVAEAGVPVNELLIVTFTRAAAAELRDRVRTRLVEAAAGLRDDAGPTDDALVTFLASSDRATRRDRLERAVADFDAATITTIHGFAQQVLTTLGSASPGDLDASLVDDARALVAEVSADVLTAAAVTEPAAVDQLPSRGELAGLALIVLGNPGIEVVPGPDPAESTEAAARRRRLVDEVVAEVQRRRRRGGTLSFDDVLTQLRDALQAGDAAKEMLRRRFTVALIDEFQDTDPVQWAIFSSLFGLPDTGTTLVLVGDPKQAIYAFRGANVHTYLEAAHAPDTQRSTLGTNWRSDGALLGALERLLAGATFGDARIGFVPVGAAEAHAGQRIGTADGAPLPALHVRAAVGADLPRNKTGPIEADPAQAAIGRDLAGHVQHLLDDAWIPAGDAAGARPGDGTGDGTGARRRVRPGDVAVLVGKHVEGTAMQAALLRQGIPAVVRRGTSVLGSPAAPQWRWLLTALTRPADPARARTAALSWFFGWSAAQIAAADDDALAAVQDQLFRWNEVLDGHGVVDFCARVWSDSGVVARVLATPDGDRDVTDLDHLAELLQTATTGRRPTAAGLLATLDQLSALSTGDADDDVTARRIESEAEAVQVMTIYAAKGLEFPVVCVPTLWRASFAKAKENKFQDPATGRRTFDVAPKENWPDKRAAGARKLLANEETLGGNLRLLYVALTRAQHQTVVWWMPMGGSAVTGLARVLFARDAAGIDPDHFAAAKATLPADDATVAVLEEALVTDDAVAITEVGLGYPRPPRWTDAAAATPAPSLEIATLDRALPRDRRRWSFSAIADRAAETFADPGDDSLGDAGAADEPVEEPSGPAVGVATGPAAAGGPAPDLAGAAALDLADDETDLPLGAVAGGADFGTLVHAVLEEVDFASDDLDAELADAIDERLRWSGWPVASDVLHAGLRAAIDTPLGPLFDGQRLRDLARADRLDELSFELRLGEAGRHATDRDLGALVLRHLPADDPLAPWATQLAAGAFGVELAGHLTGSIDAVFRLRDPADPSAPPRFVLCDYKTNTLRERGRLPRAFDYRPDRLPAAMAEHHYPLQALLYAVALHRYLRWRLPGYDPAVHLGGAAYLFVRGMTGADTPTVAGHPHGVFAWRIPPALVTELSDLLDGQAFTGGGA